jgi:phosphotransferase system IIB component
LLAALGGAGNIVDVEAVGERLALRVKDASETDEGRVRAAGFRGIADLGEGRIQVLAGGDASKVAARLTELLEVSA